MVERKKTKRAAKRGAKKTGRIVARSSRKARNCELPVIIEEVGGEPYEYVPLGKYVVAARDVCGGRPTIIYRRLDARHVMSFIKSGHSPRYVAKLYEMPVAAVEEVIVLADQFDYEARYI